MKRIKAVIAVLPLFLLVLMICVPQAQAQLTGLGEKPQAWTTVLLPSMSDDEDDDEDDDGNQGFGFGKKIAGAWLANGSFVVDVGCDGNIDLGPIPLIDTHVFDVGGSHAVTTPASLHTNLGTWEQTGPWSLAGSDIAFQVAPDGTLAFIARIDFFIDFGEDYQTANSNFEANVFLPDQDPLSDDPIACSVGHYDLFRKVNAPE